MTGNRLLSLVTPVLDPRPDHLAQAYESLVAQQMPAGWEWEWVVQEDGRSGDVARLLPPDPRVRVGVGRPHGGVGQTRNMALARSRGELVKAFDGDDVMGPGTLARDIAVLEGESGGGDGSGGSSGSSGSGGGSSGSGGGSGSGSGSGGGDDRDRVQWTTSRALDLLPDGSTVPSEHDPQPGRLEPGVVADYWRAHGYRLPVHGVTLCMRRPLLVALGGWMGVPGSDDTGLLIAASMVSTGFFHGEVGLYYRKWPGQVTAQAAHTEPEEWNARMRLIEERGEALRRIWQVG